MTFLYRDDNINEHYLGEIDVLCKHCNAKQCNLFNDCFGHRSVELESIPDFPDKLCLLFKIVHLESMVLFARIRNYNSSFSFASFNANLVNLQQWLPIVFKAKGKFITKQMRLYIHHGKMRILNMVNFSLLILKRLLITG